MKKEQKADVLSSQQKSDSLKGRLARFDPMRHGGEAMSECSNNTEWHDPDDAPDISAFDPHMEKGSWHIGKKAVTVEEGLAAFCEQISNKPTNIT